MMMVSSSQCCKCVSCIAMGMIGCVDRVRCVSCSTMVIMYCVGCVSCSARLMIDVVVMDEGLSWWRREQGVEVV